MMSLPCIAVGGGLAGAAFALELARNGRRVIVLEKTRAAHHKVCGEFLSAEAQALIAYVGLDIWALGATTIDSFRLACGVDFPILNLPFRAAGLSRFCLDEALLEAAARAGAEVVRGATVTRLQPAAGAVLVHTPEREFRAECAALATGKHDLRGYPRSKGSMVSFKLQLCVSPAAAALLRNVVHLTMFPGGYVGACLVEGGLATICWVIEQDLLNRIGTRWPAQAEYLSTQSEFFGDVLSGAQALWDKPVAVAAIPHGFLRGKAIAESIYPVGDQLAVIPSYTGDGTSIALQSGIAAARAVLKEEPADEFQRTMTSRLRPQMMWAKAGNLLFSTATAQRLSAAIAQAMPWALPRLAACLVNATRLRGFDPPSEVAGNRA